MPPMTFGFRALESYRAAVVKVGHYDPVSNSYLCQELAFQKGKTKQELEALLESQAFQLRIN